MEKAKDEILTFFMKHDNTAQFVNNYICTPNLLLYIFLFVIIESFLIFIIRNECGFLCTISLIVLLSYIFVVLFQKLFLPCYIFFFQEVDDSNSTIHINFNSKKSKINKKKVAHNATQAVYKYIRYLKQVSQYIIFTPTDFYSFICTFPIFLFIVLLTHLGFRKSFALLINILFFSPLVLYYLGK